MKNKNKKQMSLEDAQTLVKIAYYLGEMNKAYGYPHGKSPMGILIYATAQMEQFIKQGKTL